MDLFCSLRVVAEYPSVSISCHVFAVPVSRKGQAVQVGKMDPLNVQFCAEIL